MMFSLYIDRNIIGFAMMCYIKSERLIIIEYIALSESYRKNTVFLPYINLLRNYLIIKGYDIAYIIVEISNKGDGKNIDKESHFFKKNIFLEGFGVIQAPYYTLPLGLNNYDSNFEAHIFVKSNDNIKQISKEKFLDIVNAIYYEYFLNWYSAFYTPKDIASYKEKIDSNYEIIKSKTQNDDYFDIKYSECNLVFDSNEYKTHGILPIKIPQKAKVYPIVIMLLIFFPIIIIWTYSCILEFLNISMSSVSSVIGSIIGAIITAISFYYFSQKSL